MAFKWLKKILGVIYYYTKFSTLFQTFLRFNITNTQETETLKLCRMCSRLFLGELKRTEIS